MFFDYVQLGLRNLKQRGLRSWLTMIGIFIGIAAVVSLISLGQGMQDAITSQFAALGADTITVQAAGGGFGPPGSYQASLIGKDDLRIIKRVRGVEAAFGRLIEPVTIKVDGEQDYGYLVSISDENDEYDFSVSLPTPLETVKGRMVKPEDNCKLVIGNDISTKEVYVRRLDVGDKILLDNTAFDIIGILKKTGNPQLDRTFFAPETCVRNLLDEKEKFGLIVAKVASGEEPSIVQERIEKALRKSREVELGKEDFVVSTSQETIDSLKSILGAVQWVLIGIAGISLLVGGVGITNTMYTAVLERTREIGIMKAIGARNSEVLTIFLIESGLLGMAGGAIGIIIGMGLSSSVAFIAKVAWGTSLIEANYSWWLIAGALTFSFLVGALSGILPARQASNMHPVEALTSG